MRFDLHNEGYTHLQQPIKKTFCESLRRDTHWKCLLLSLMIYACLTMITWCRVQRVVVAARHGERVGTFSGSDDDGGGGGSSAPVYRVDTYRPRHDASSYDVSDETAGACDRDGYVYIPVAFVVMLYLVYLVECWHCHTRITLQHKVDVNSVYDRIAQMRDALPVVWWKAVCYHYVRRSRQVTRYRNGDTTVSPQVYYERVNSHNASSAFNFTNCGMRDVSRTLVNLEKFPATKIKFSKAFSFATHEAEQEFEEQRGEFFAEHELRDDYMETREGLDLINIHFREYAIAFADTDNLPWYVSQIVFWLASGLVLSWPLRVLIEYKTAHVRYHVHKLFGCNYLDDLNLDSPGFMSRVSTIGSMELELMSARNNYTMVPSYSEAILMDSLQPRTHQQQHHLQRQRDIDENRNVTVNDVLGSTADDITRHGSVRSLLVGGRDHANAGTPVTANDDHSSTAVTRSGSSSSSNRPATIQSSEVIQSKRPGRAAAAATDRWSTNAGNHRTGRQAATAVVAVRRQSSRQFPLTWHSRFRRSCKRLRPHSMAEIEPLIVRPERSSTSAAASASMSATSTGRRDRPKRSRSMFASILHSPPDVMPDLVPTSASESNDALVLSDESLQDEAALGDDVSDATHNAAGGASRTSTPSFRQTQLTGNAVATAVPVVRRNSSSVASSSSWATRRVREPSYENVASITSAFRVPCQPSSQYNRPNAVYVTCCDNAQEDCDDVRICHFCGKRQKTNVHAETSLAAVMTTPAADSQCRHRDVSASLAHRQVRACGAHNQLQMNSETVVSASELGADNAAARSQTHQTLSCNQHQHLRTVSQPFWPVATGGASAGTCVPRRCVLKLNQRIPSLRPESNCCEATCDTPRLKTPVPTSCDLVSVQTTASRDSYVNSQSLGTTNTTPDSPPSYDAALFMATPPSLAGSAQASTLPSPVCIIRPLSRHSAELGCDVDCVADAQATTEDTDHASSALWHLSAARNNEWERENVEVDDSAYLHIMETTL